MKKIILAFLLCYSVIFYLSALQNVTHNLLAEKMDSKEILDLTDQFLATQPSQKELYYSYYLKSRWYYQNFQKETANKWALLIPEDNNLHSFLKIHEIEMFLLQGRIPKALSLMNSLTQKAHETQKEFLKQIAALSVIKINTQFHKNKDAYRMVIKLLQQRNLSPTIQYILYQHLHLLSLIDNNKYQLKKACLGLKKQNKYDPYLQTKVSDLLGEKFIKIKERLQHTWYYVFCCDMSNIENSKKVYNYIQEIKSLIPQAPSFYLNFSCQYMDVKYDISTERYNEAYKKLQTISTDSFQSISQYRMSLIKDKAYCLEKMNRLPEAVELWETYTELKDTFVVRDYSIKIENTNKQLQQRWEKRENLRLQTTSAKLKAVSFLLILLILLLITSLIILHQVRKQTKKEKDRAERSHYLKSSFLANMNHEIRSPLNAISGFSQLLAEETTVEQSKMYQEIIEYNNKLLTRLLNDVQDLSQIESDTLKFDYQTIDLSAVFERLYNVHLSNMSPDIDFVLDIPTYFLLKTDEDRLLQIMNNLITNAIKHTTSGSIHFGYKQRKDNIFFFVSDTGTGIPQEKQEVIFSRFIQTANYKSDGVGLGLALCKGLVEKMNGEIGVQSTVGTGSTFWFTLPL